MCVTVCTGLTNGGDAFSITTPTSAAVTTAQTDLATAITGGVAATIATAQAALVTAQNNAALNSAVGATNAAGNQATCLYDFLLIAGGREAATGFAADRYCGGALNPTPIVPPAATASVQVCSKLKLKNKLIVLNIIS